MIEFVNQNDSNDNSNIIDLIKTIKVYMLLKERLCTTFGFIKIILLNNIKSNIVGSTEEMQIELQRLIYYLCNFMFKDDFDQFIKELDTYSDFTRNPKQLTDKICEEYDKKYLRNHSYSNQRESYSLNLDEYEDIQYFNFLIFGKLEKEKSHFLSKFELNRESSKSKTNISSYSLTTKIRNSSFCLNIINEPDLMNNVLNLPQKLKEVNGIIIISGCTHQSNKIIQEWLDENSEVIQDSICILCCENSKFSTEYVNLSKLAKNYQITYFEYSCDDEQWINKLCTLMYEEKEAKSNKLKDSKAKRMFNIHNKCEGDQAIDIDEDFLQRILKSTEKLQMTKDKIKILNSKNIFSPISESITYPNIISINEDAKNSINPLLPNIKSSLVNTEIAIIEDFYINSDENTEYCIHYNYDEFNESLDVIIDITQDEESQSKALINIIYDQLNSNRECKYLIFSFCDKFEYDKTKCERNIEILSDFKNQIKEATIIVLIENENDKRINRLLTKYTQIVIECIKNLNITEIIFDSFTGSLLNKFFKEDNINMFESIHFLRFENIKCEEIDWDAFSKLKLDHLNCLSLHNCIQLSGPLITKLKRTINPNLSIYQYPSL